MDDYVRYGRLIDDVIVKSRLFACISLFVRMKLKRTKTSILILFVITGFC